MRVIGSDLDGTQSVGLARFMTMLSIVVVLSAFAAKATWMILDAQPAKSMAGFVSSCDRPGSDEGPCADPNDEAALTSPVTMAAPITSGRQPDVQSDRAMAAAQQSEVDAKAAGDGPVEAQPVRAEKTRVSHDAAVLPETGLPLLLKGVVMAGRGTGSNMAIIAENGQDDRLYKVGNGLPGGAILSEIHPEGVVLTRTNGKREVLPLYGGPWTESTGAPISEEGELVKEKSGDTLKDRLVAFRSEVIAEPTRFADRVHYQPVIRDGKISGFTISPRNKDDFLLFRSAGLNPGDLVTHVNGQPLGQVAALPALALKLAGATEISLDVERNGRTETVVLTLD